MFVDLPDEFDAGTVEQRLDQRFEIDVVDAVNLGCDLERDAKGTRNLDGAVGALLR